MSQRADSALLDMSRKALRDFYKLRPQEPQEAPAEVRDKLPDSEDDVLSELDAPGFDADKFVEQLSDGEILNIVKAHRELITQVRTLDSEQKALVYNNYKKLIKASETLEYTNASNSEWIDKLAAEIDSIADLVRTKHTTQITVSSGNFADLRSHYLQTYLS